MFDTAWGSHRGAGAGTGRDPPAGLPPAPPFGTGKNPADRANLGWKWSILCDRAGIPIGWTLAGAKLPFLATAVAIGLELGEITPETGAALVSAGLLSVIVFPIVALGVLRPGPSATDHPEP